VFFRFRESEVNKNLVTAYIIYRAKKKISLPICNMNFIPNAFSEHFGHMPSLGFIQLKLAS
jgi:hypothetical protein